MCSESGAIQMEKKKKKRAALSEKLGARRSCGFPAVSASGQNPAASPCDVAADLLRAVLVSLDLFRPAHVYF